MKSKFWIGCSVLLGFACALASGGCHHKPAQGKTITLKLHLPKDNVTVFVDEQEVKGSGAVRAITRSMPDGKDFVNVKAVFEPNDYTKITRPRKVIWKDGDIVVDFLDPSPTEKDDIVVRFVATPQEVVDAMCKLAKVGKDDVVYDLGCGDGRMVITAVKDFGAKRGVGVDLDPQLVARCKQDAMQAGVVDRLDFRVGDVLKVDDLADANVVLLYMGEDINVRLRPVLQKTLKPGSRVVSHRFLMGSDWPPQQTETIKIGNTKYDIHQWVISEPK